MKLRGIEEASVQLEVFPFLLNVHAELGEGRTFPWKEDAIEAG